MTLVLNLQGIHVNYFEQFLLKMLKMHKIHMERAKDNPILLKNH